MHVPRDFPRAALTLIGELALQQLSTAGNADACSLTRRQEARMRRFAACEDLATHVVVLCSSKRYAEFSGRSEAVVLDEMLALLMSRNLGSLAELRWVIRRAAMYLHWEAPASALELTAQAPK